MTEARRRLPKTLTVLIIGICVDYERRRRALQEEPLREQVRNTYLELNRAVEKALEEVEPALRTDVLGDIAEGISYWHSSASLIISRNGYYRRRRRFLFDIARELCLV